MTCATPRAIRLVFEARVRFALAMYDIILPEVIEVLC
jgi:hypothetical protein